MRIPGIERLFSIVNAKFRKAEELARPTETRQVRTDRVEISERAQKAQSTRFEMIDPSERARRVEEIKAQFERGELEVDAEAIAREMTKDGYFNDITGS
jgi:flagellar biosynthesis anti-sigma factor FlgM